MYDVYEGDYMNPKLILTFERELSYIKRLAEMNKILVYGASTCYWLIGRPVYSHPDTGLPCGPRSEMLMECHDPSGFIRDAEDNPQYYGRHGLDAFIAAYHGNLVVASSGFPTSYSSWEEYNLLLDKQLGIPNTETPRRRVMI